MMGGLAFEQKSCIQSHDHYYDSNEGALISILNIIKKAKPTNGIDKYFSKVAEV